MQKEKIYELTRFSPDVVHEAYQAFIKMSKLTKPLFQPTMEVENDNESWGFDNLEEFFAEVRKNPQKIHLFIFDVNQKYRFNLRQYENYVRIGIDAPSRQSIEGIFEIFESNLINSRIKEPVMEEKPCIFIGHGRNQQWRDLKDHLHEKHGFRVEAYETGERAGHTIRDILENMLEESSLAILVLTGEDEDIEGKFHPRLNVVHELGLFQGHLGFSKAIALLEEGTEEFSNIYGIHQIRFPKGRIKETFGDVLATIRREFVDN